MQNRKTMTIVLVTAFLVHAALAEVPQMINYQGRLTDNTGAPVADGPYQVKFKIYGSAAGFDSLWWSGFQTVQVANGLFDYKLGSMAPLPNDLFSTDTTRYLGITVGADPEITPRSRLLTVPYAFNAKNGGGWTDDGTVVRLTNSDDNVNIGGPGPYWNNLYVESSEGALGGATAFIKNTNTSDGIGLMIENASHGLSLLVSQQGEHPDGEILRCDSYTGGWKAVYRIMNNGRTIIGNPTFPKANTMLEVKSDSIYAGYFTSNRESDNCHIVHAEYTGVADYVDEDPIAIYGNSSQGDKGFGGYFIGGNCGLIGQAEPTSGGNALYVGVTGTVTGGTLQEIGVRGQASGIGTSAADIGVKGEATGEGANFGVFGLAQGTGSMDIGVQGIAMGSGMNQGIYGFATGADQDYGVKGTAIGSGAENYGVYGYSDGASEDIGVKGEALGSGYNCGVSGKAQGESNDVGVRAEAIGSDENWGVYAKAYGGYRNTGIFAQAYGGSVDYAGFFDGDVYINGILTGGKGTIILDHPLDPANKYLKLSSVNSPEMKNVFDGVVILDAYGRATVELPEYFEVLNESFRYQLTCIGGYAPVYIAEKISNNQFVIDGGQPNMEVSWMVTGIRKDAFAKANPMEVEVDKPEKEIGKYLAPEALGYGPELHINYEQRQLHDEQEFGDSKENTEQKSR